MRKVDEEKNNYDTGMETIPKKSQLKSPFLQKRLSPSQTSLPSKNSLPVPLPSPQTKKLAFENAKDIIACGFNPEKTFIFQNFNYIQSLYEPAIKIAEKLPFNQVRGAFGFNLSNNIGQVSRED
jgi:hypothetical protein